MLYLRTERIMSPGVRLSRVGEVSVMVGRCVMVGRVMMIQSGRMCVIGLCLTEQIVLLTPRLLLRHPVMLLLLLLVTLWRLVVAVPERRWETPLGHGESTCHGEYRV